MNSAAVQPLYGNLMVFPSQHEEPSDVPRAAHRYDYSRKEAVNGTVDPITDTEHIKMILSYFFDKRQYRNWCLFYLGCNIALRASDLLRIKVNEVAYKQADGSYKTPPEVKLRIKEKKTQKYRELIVPADALPVIEYYLNHTRGIKKTDYLFKSAHGRNPGDPISVDSFGDLMKEVQRELKLPYNLGTHSCRKTFAYHWFQQHRNDAGALASLQKMLNHSSQLVTLRYIGLDRMNVEQFYREFSYGFSALDESIGGGK